MIEFDRRSVVYASFAERLIKIKEIESNAMSGLSGTKSDDFINAAKARGEAAVQDNKPRLTKLETAFRHAALRRKAEDARKASGRNSNQH